MSIAGSIIPGYQFTGGETQSNAKLNQLGRPVLNIEADIEADEIKAGAVTAAKAKLGAFWYGVDSGTTDAYVVTYATAIKPSAWVDGALFIFKANTANSGAATFAPNDLTAKAIVTPDNQPLRDGAIPALGIVAVRYNSSLDAVVLESAVANGVPLIQSAVTTASHATVGAVTTTTYVVTVPAYLKADFSGADARVVFFQAPAANQGQVNIQLKVIAESDPTATQTLVAKALFKNGSTVMAAADIAANQWLAMIYDADGGGFQLLSPVNAPAVPVPPRDTGRNVVMVRGDATHITLTADELILQDAAGTLAYRASAVNVVVDIGVNGANGLEYNGDGTAKAKAASTLYWAWVIYNGTTVAGLLSTSATAPTLPTGYTYAARICGIRTDVSQNLIETYYRDGRYAIKDSATIPTAGGVRTALHPFAQTPSFFSVKAYCDTLDAGYVATKEVDLTAIRNRSDFALPYHADADYTGVYVVASSAYAALMGINHATSGAFSNLTPANWTFKFYFEE